MTAKTNRRWMRTALAGSVKCDVVMPWQRGAQRSEMLARRDGPQAAQGVRQDQMRWRAKAAS
ncbi:hypothetical protein SAMN05877809_103120 [Rhodobacter sp. JA431]|uniref:hypothetical protein n=1 Tax=Rhodobacter sp. JA431 TaxID=570013 RepID=UPI000BCFD5A1|nr:hypothetical protein [Rhodobacter sp. JA431]SOC04035.1 hypothetical protein SAMN05877809_103120 [Rhodobacter sp. JA431]